MVTTAARALKQLVTGRRDVDSGGGGSKSGGDGGEEIIISDDGDDLDGGFSFSFTFSSGILGT